MERSYPVGKSISPNAFVDLQTHTHLSDGTWTPEELIDHLVQEGFSAAAITDHDCVDTLTDVQRTARERGLPLLVATEMTTHWQEHVVDILCFGFECDPSSLQELCTALRQAQTDTSRQVCEYLIQGGYIPGDDVEIEAIFSATAAKQPHFLVELYLKHNSGTEDFGPLGRGGYKLCTNSVAAVVEAAHRGGGVALIAHPGRTDGFATFDADLLDQFSAEVPIDGLEVYYPRHTPQQTSLYETYTAERGWLVSAGSDSHKPDDPPIKYRASQCIALLERLDFTVTEA